MGAAEALLGMTGGGKGTIGIIRGGGAVDLAVAAGTEAVAAVVETEAVADDFFIIRPGLRPRLAFLKTKL